MTSEPRPVEARSAKRMLRRYAIIIPAAALIGGYCSLLQTAWVALPNGVVDHIPTFVKVTTFFISVAWWCWLYRTFRRLPRIIDEILDYGISMTIEPTSRAAGKDHNKACQRRPLNVTCAEPPDF